MFYFKMTIDTFNYIKNKKATVNYLQQLNFEDVSYIIELHIVYKS